MKFKKFEYKSVISTNNTAIRLIKTTNFNSGMVISETQKKGRGQYGKKWISLKGNLFVSFFFNTKGLKVNLKKLTKINCLLVKKLLSSYYKKEIIYKRPNDLLIEKKKICGILQEIINKYNKKYLVVGIGINLKKNPNLKNYPSTNLYDLTGLIIKKKKIENELKKIFESRLTQLYR